MTRQPVDAFILYPTWLVSCVGMWFLPQAAWDFGTDANCVLCLLGFLIVGTAVVTIPVVSTPSRRRYRITWTGAAALWILGMWITVHTACVVGAHWGFRDGLAH